MLKRHPSRVAFFFVLPKFFSFFGRDVDESSTIRGRTLHRLRNKLFCLWYLVIEIFPDRLDHTIL